MQCKAVLGFVAVVVLCGLCLAWSSRLRGDSKTRREEHYFAGGESAEELVSRPSEPRKSEGQVGPRGLGGGAIAPSGTYNAKGLGSLVVGSSRDAAPNSGSRSDSRSPTSPSSSQIQGLLKSGQLDELWAFVQSDRSLARYEALRRYIELSEGLRIEPLINLLSEDLDETVHGFLGAALGMRLQEGSVGELLAILDDVQRPDSARLAAGLALAKSSEGFSEKARQVCRESAARTFAELVSKDRGFASEAIRSLQYCGEPGVGCLRGFAKDPGLGGLARVEAAIGLSASRPDEARRLLDGLLRELDDDQARELARRSLRELQGS